MVAKRLHFGLLAILLLGEVPGRAQTVSTEEDHKSSILGIQVGMTAADVMDRLKRQADAAKDENDRTILTWKLSGGNLLRIGFWKEHVIAVRLVYKKPRPATELWLTPLPNPSSTELTAPDPRWRRDYKITQDNALMYLVWRREEKAPAGYLVQISFFSTSRKEMGDRYDEFVEYKDVAVPYEEKEIAAFARSIGAAPPK